MTGPLESTGRPRRVRTRVLTVGVVLALAAVTLQALDAARSGAAPSAAAAYRAPATYGIWPDAAPRSAVRRVPATVVGTRFRTGAAGVVTALRYYAAGRAGRPVRMQLWTSGGRELGSVRLGRGRGTGWRAQALARPVRLDPRLTYVVSYTVPRGQVARRAGAFARGGLVRHGALVASASVTGRGRGYPTKRSTAAFFADVLFRPDVSAPGPTGSPTVTDTPGPGSDRFPTADTAGVPAGWQPKQTYQGTLTISTPGAVVEDVRVVGGGIEVAADNVTLRRVEVVGGWIGNWPDVGSCTKGLLMQQVSVVAAPGQDTSDLGAAISTGGYTADRVKIDGLPEGFRVGGALDGCGPVTIKSSFVRIEQPTSCGTNDWHGDGLQGYQGGALTIRDTVIVFHDSPQCEGTAPFFYPDQDNTSVDIDGLVVDGGGYSFRLGTRGTVHDLYVVKDYRYGPLDVNCDLLSGWVAYEATLDDHGQPVVGPGDELPCGGR